MFVALFFFCYLKLYLIYVYNEETSFTFPQNYLLYCSFIKIKCIEKESSRVIMILYVVVAVLCFNKLAYKRSKYSKVTM